MTQRIESTVLEIDVDRCANTYGVAPCTAAGTEKCYNTFGTCQDKPNFVRGVQTIRFTGVGSPIPLGQRWRPYIVSVENAPTELDPSKGLAVRSALAVKLVDETDADRETDPYIATRSPSPGGTFWQRLLARNKHLVGRPARLSRAFIDGDGVRGAETIERFVVEAVKGPDPRGEITLSLKDPIKLTDRAKAPTPSSGALALDMLINDMQLTLTLGKGAEYPSAGYVRIGDEIIRYDGKVGDVLTWSSSSYRATWGTEANAHETGELVQLCLHYDNQRVWQVLKDLLNRSGVEDAIIDLAGMEDQDDSWLSEGYRITTLLSDPTDISQLLRELSEQTIGALWWSETEQKVRYRVILPDSPAATAVAPLTNEANLVNGTFTVERQDTERLTFVAMYYGLSRATDDPDKVSNFRLGEAVIDQDAESENEYGDRRTKVMTSRWFYGPQNTRAMRTLVRRLLGRYRDPPRSFTFSLDPKDDSVRPGVLRDLTHPSVTDVTGQPKTVRALVTRRKRSSGRVEVKAVETTFDRRYAFIAPAGTPNYPNNNGYACVSNAAGNMSDGTGGYLVI